MTKYILAGGAIYKAPDKGRVFIQELIKDTVHKPAKILVCIFAEPKETWNQKFEGDKEYFSNFISDFELELADEDTFSEQVKNSDVIYLRGGHTQQLFKLLTKNLDWINYLEGKTLAGTSAGAEVLSTYIYDIDDLKINENLLTLLPIKLITHYRSDYNTPNVDWDKAYYELKNYKEDLEILTLKEGEFKVLYK